MAKEKPKTVVPKLRFPEFRELGGWPLKSAGELFQNRQEKGADDLPIYSVTTDSGMVKRSSLDRKIDDLADSEGNKKVCKNDIAYNMMRMWQGAFGIAAEDCMVSPAYIVLAPNADVSTAFYGQLLKTPQSLRRLTAQSHGLTEDRLRLYYKDFASIQLVNPEPDEQKKIADCLTSLDELIAAQGRKVEALKTYKRGLMQQLFPREGETVPRLRFPEFKSAPGWREVKAGVLFDNRTERGHASLPVYSVTMTDGLVKRTSLDRKIDDLSDSSGNKKVCQKDIAYNMMRMWQGACGIATEDCMVSPAYVVLSPKSGAHSPFYGYLFKLPHMLRLFILNSRGLTEDRLRLYFQDFCGIPMPQPALSEQNRIANCLLALDARIKVEADKLSALKTHKQAIMQQLFPSVQEDAA